MIKVPREEFEKYVDRAVNSLPKDHLLKVENVAFIVEGEPSLDQRTKLKLRNDQSLYGLYEGVPLSDRQGTTKIYPDKITIFQLPIEYMSNSIEDLKERIGRTVWHEVAHYFGLNHDQIYSLEDKEKNI